jgi:hypothetical protein
VEFKVILKAFIAALTLGAAFASYAVDDPDWLRLTLEGESTFYFKRGSFDTELLQNGSEMAFVLGKREGRKSKLVKFYKFKVTREACAKGYGTLLIANLSDETLVQSDFVKDGGNVGSAMAALICAELAVRDSADAAAAAADAAETQSDDGK